MATCDPHRYYGGPRCMSTGRLDCLVMAAHTGA